MTRQHLEHTILTAFKQAVTEGRLDVADHLLKALEVLSVDGERDAVLAETYLFLADRLIVVPNERDKDSRAIAAPSGRSEQGLISHRRRLALPPKGGGS